VRDCRLERVEAIIKGQQGVLAEGDDDRLFVSIDSTVECGSFGPVGRSATEVRFFHFATVF
jgi:hypothetical protein